MAEPKFRPSAGALHDTLVGELVRGERRFHDLPASLDPDEAAAIRRRALEEMLRVSLDHVGHYSLDGRRAARNHCENFIGVAQVPLGVAGPLPVRGERLDGDVWVPLATTEAALVASINRGCSALREAGGAIVQVTDAGMTRAPVFRTSGARETARFLEWVADHEDDIRRACQATSRYVRLLEIKPYVVGSSVYLRFRFGTGDAMGMNMVTIACDRAVRDLIEPETGVACVALSGNLCVDKKPAWINFLEGRGKRIHAEALLPKAALDKLKTTAAELAEVQYRKNLLGSIAAGSKGFNAHYANILAAFFIATGQDPAHVVEGSMGITCCETRDDGAAYVSVDLPDVPLAAVGGGTGLATQSEALSMLGVRVDPDHPGHAVQRLAEIAGAVVLAGELSLLAAFTTQDLAPAHEKLGRNGPRP